MPTADESPPLELTTRVEGDAAVISVRGEVDVASAPALRGAIRQVIDDGSTRVVLDLADLEFIDSSGLGVLVGALKNLRERDGALVLRAVPPSTRKILDITGLSDVIPSED